VGLVEDRLACRHAHLVDHPLRLCVRRRRHQCHDDHGNQTDRHADHAEAQVVDMAVRQLGSITVIDFRDRRLIDTARIEALGEQIGEIIANTPAIKLLISFEKVEYLSSTMLNVLIGIDNAIKRKQGKLALANLQPELQKVFTLMKLNKVMKICKSTDDAISAMK
jgi:anti-sigma B factor antagonist